MKIPSSRLVLHVKYTPTSIYERDENKLHIKWDKNSGETLCGQTIYSSDKSVEELDKRHSLCSVCKRIYKNHQKFDRKIIKAATITGFKL